MRTLANLGRRTAVRAGMLRIASAGLVVVAAAACAGATSSATAPDGSPTPEGPPPAAHPRPGTDIVDPALAWLASRQAPDGSWDGDAGTTGLVLLAFLGTGETHQSGTHKETLRRGLASLCDRQDADGCLVPRTSPEFPRDHAFAAIALCEAYGLTSSVRFREPARRGVEFARTTGAADGGWSRAGTVGAVLDVETTGWMTLLFNSAVSCEAGDRPTYATAQAATVAAFDRVTDPVTGRVADDASELGTELALLARILAGRTPMNDPLLRRTADVVLETPPSVATAQDVLRTYLGTLSLYQFGGRRWRAWADPMDEATRAGAQFVDGDPGLVVWDPHGDGTAAGSVRATALCVMTRSAFHRVGDRDGWRREGEKWNE